MMIIVIIRLHYHKCKANVSLFSGSFLRSRANDDADDGYNDDDGDYY